MLRLLGAVVLVTAALFLSGCENSQTGRAFEVAQTPAQKAYAAYGLFTAAEEEAAVLVKNPAVPRSAIELIKSLDALAKPAADAMLIAVRSYTAIKTEVDATPAGVSPAADRLTALRTALASVQRTLNDAAPKIDDFAGAVRSVGGNL